MCKNSTNIFKSQKKELFTEKYAPVIIPTLNRYNHFYKCLESLEKCTGADKTEVYIALDYPPSEKYVEGWRKIDEYLRLKEQNNKFGQLHVIRRERNYGIANPNSNARTILKYIEEKYPKYICSEDDNVFSPNFLEYINKGLEKYENDESVFAIVGYAHPYKFKFDGNNHYRHNTDMSAWGYGYWTEKRRKLDEFINDSGFKKSLSIRNVIKVGRHGWNRLLTYIQLLHHREFTWTTDALISVYLMINDMYVIVPTVSKVRNIGWDENGCSFANGVDDKIKHIADRHNNQPIDENMEFNYVGDDTKFLEYNNRVAVKESDGRISFWTFIRTLFASIIKYLSK